jgi:hypothetical protein
MASNRTELVALKNMLSETDLVLSTTKLPENRTARARELLRAALALTDDLISQSKLSAASIMGRKGGAVIAKRGSDYFRKLAARRKHHRGGRPRKQPE